MQGTDWQRPHVIISALINAGEGNVLMDIVAFLDEATKQKIKQLGGVHAIYFSHPHYYGMLAERTAQLLPCKACADLQHNDTIHSIWPHVSHLMPHCLC